MYTIKQKYTDLIIPEELEGASTSIPLDELTQDEVDRLAEFARTLKNEIEGK